MYGERHLRRKLTVRAAGQQVVLVKKPVERLEHVLMKAFLWALYLPSYGDLAVEVSVGDRYKPDVVSLDPFGRPRFWGEAGKVSDDKIVSLARRYRHTHFALAKWNASMAHLLPRLRPLLADIRREAPVDLLLFEDRHADACLSDRGDVAISFDDVRWARIE